MAFWQWSSLLLLLLLLSNIEPTCSQTITTAQIILSNPGTQFIPVNAPAQLISTTITDSFKTCTMLCINNVMCRVFDYEASESKECRLFEGDTVTLGKIVPSSSSSSQSNAAAIHLSSDLFVEYDSACSSSSCYQSRYLQCGINFTCECVSHTYWDPSISMCVAQSTLLGASCKQNLAACREDLNYTCLQFNQCGPLSVLSAVTIMNSSTAVSGSSTAGVSQPSGIHVFGTDIVSVIIADSVHNRILRLLDDGTNHRNISVIATEWAPGYSLYRPVDVYVDIKNGYNLYVCDIGSDNVILYTNMQSVNPPPLVVAGNAPTYLKRPIGACVDSHSNVIVASSFNNFIMIWPPNATNGTILCGASASSMGLNKPCGMAFDEHSTWLYVADLLNHRIQRYSMNDTGSCVGTTVAGGNGWGRGSHQLAYPVDVWVSNKTRAIYIVDAGNNRIQLWKQGATNGVTIAGDPNGNSGTDATKLRNPAALAINENETLMYITDMDNSRLQRFQLI